MKKDAFDLSGKQIAVTGGASGLAKAMALALAQRGADVCVLDINAGKAAETARDVKALGRKSFSVPVDVSEYESVRAAFAQVVKEWGSIDAAVNAAGVAGGRKEDTTPEAIWRRVLGINLSGVYYCCLQEAEIMKKQRSGTIVNMASMSAQIVNRFPDTYIAEGRQLGLYPYCSSKAGVRQLTKVFAAFLAPHNIRVNCISPGYMRTPLTDELFSSPELTALLEGDTPLGRVGEPEDLGALIVYLVSDGSSFMTGSEITIDGGFTVW